MSESAADVIDHPAARHRVQRAFGDPRRFGRAGAMRIAQQQCQRRIGRELGRGAETTGRRIKSA